MSLIVVLFLFLFCNCEALWSILWFLNVLYKQSWIGLDLICPLVLDLVSHRDQFVEVTLFYYFLKVEICHFFLFLLRYITYKTQIKCFVILCSVHCLRSRKSPLSEQLNPYSVLCLHWLSYACHTVIIGVTMGITN